jgi:two-component system, LytTR family, response regulator
MKPVRTLIAEDEPLAAEGLAAWVNEAPQLELVGVCGDGASALQAVREQQPELLLLDIHMPGMNGLQVLRALQDERSGIAPLVIFTTAYDAHAVTAFELHAVDYLLKPFTQARFNEAVAHALQTRNAAAAGAQDALQALVPAAAAPLTRVLVRDRGGVVPLLMSEVEHLKSDTKYTALSANGKSYLVRLPITAFEQRLDPERFLKLNRSCIVNLDFVQSMNPDENSQYVVRLRDGSSVTASRDVSKHLRSIAL